MQLDKFQLINYDSTTYLVSVELSHNALCQSYAVKVARCINRAKAI